MKKALGFPYDTEIKDHIMIFDEKTKTSIKGMSENEIEIYAKILASNIIQTVLHVTYINILKQMMEIHGGNTTSE